MDDRDLEDLVRRYAPLGPPPGLRARIFTTPVSGRTWPWAVAGAASLALTIVLHDGANRTQAAIATAANPLPSVDAFAALRGIATDQEIAHMEMMAEIERADAPAPTPEVPAWP